MSRSAVVRRSAVLAAPAAITLAAMIATPLAGRGGTVRRRLASVVVCGLGVTTAAASTRRWGAIRTTAAAAALIGTTGAVERTGSSTGRPFGRYCYSGALRPTVAGVPAIVPIAWWAMALPAREVAVAVLCGRRSSRAARLGLGAVALTAWDLFLDPQMVGEGYWRWDRRGSYAGIPLSNYAGWLVTSAAVMAVLDVTLPPDAPDPVLVGEYATMGALETIGFAAFFRQRLVAVVGGAGMLPVAAVAMASTWRQRSAR